jgi:sugar phosphate isomerase/epimerase
MKLGVFDPVFGDADLDETLGRVVALGLNAIEFAAGGYPGNRRCQPDALLADPSALERFRAAVEGRGLEISALSCHGNPIHPDPSLAAADDHIFRQTVRLAEALEVDRINVFSGCPGDQTGGNTPNWVTCSWPPEFGRLLEWQWETVVVPYWTEAGSFARDHGVRLGFEMHPGFSVYSPRTLRRLRDEVGEVVGANLDPSHLFWQGIDPILAIKELGGAVFHVHAKDTFVDPHNVARFGVLDVTDAGNLSERSWYFRSVGDGHDLTFWKQFVSALRVAGYDHVVSIEHEDRLASRDEGLLRATAVLKQAILEEPATAQWW